MIRRQDIDRLRVTGLRPIGCAAAAALVLLSSPANAQTSSYQPATDNVYINWGAINGGQASPSTPQQSSPSYNYRAPAASGGLLMPGPRMPQSTLHVPAPASSSTVKLRQPGSAPKMAAKPSQPKAPAPAPTPKVAEAPKPAEAAPKQLTEKKAPPPPPAPAPAKTAETASAPPPPPAPETASAPPPPPMPSSSEPAAAPKQTEQAAAPKKDKAPEQASAPTTTPADGPVQVVFNGDDTKLSADGQSALDAVIGKLSADENARDRKSVV